MRGADCQWRYQRKRVVEVNDVRLERTTDLRHLMRGERIADRTQRAFDFPSYPPNRPACAYLIGVADVNRNRVAMFLQQGLLRREDPVLAAWRRRTVVVMDKKDFHASTPRSLFT